MTERSSAVGAGPMASPSAEPLTTDAFLRDLWPVLWDSMDDGLHVTDGEGRNVYATPSYCRMLGYRLGELIGEPFTRVVPPAQTERYRELFRQIVDGALGSLGAEMLLQRRDGSQIQASVRHSRLLLGGRVLHAFVVRDVTQQRALEQQLLEHDRMKALGTLAGGVAHEFNNLLVSILGYAEMIDEEPGDERAVRRFARKVQRAARRGRELTAQLLPFARREEVSKQAVDLHQVLQEVVGLFRSSLGAELRVDADLASPQHWVVGNRLQLQQVFLNLFLNARDAMEPEGGVLRVHTFFMRELGRPLPDGEPAQHGYVRVRVQDEGHGMDPEVLRRLFEPFYTTREAGKGVGLALVYAAVKGHGGAVAVESQPGQGCTMDVFLPVVNHES